MFLHKSILIHEVRVQNPDPVFAEKLLEQYGGATGELSAALTYLTQSYHTENPGIRDMLQDIGTEELGHLEVIALLIEQHTSRASVSLQDKAYQSKRTHQGVERDDTAGGNPRPRPSHESMRRA